MTLSNLEIDQAQLLELMAKVKSQSSEIKRLKLHLSRYALPDTYQEFTNEIWSKHRAIGELLRTAHVRRFDNPRLWIDFLNPNPRQRVMIVFQLKPFLKLWTAGKYGNPFRLKIRILYQSIQD